MESMLNSLACLISRGLVVSVKYSVIRGIKLELGGNAFKMESRYATAAAVVVTGGFRFGMMIALPKLHALYT